MTGCPEILPQQRIGRQFMQIWMKLHKTRIGSPNPLIWYPVVVAVVPTDDPLQRPINCPTRASFFLLAPFVGSEQCKLRPGQSSRLSAMVCMNGRMPLLKTTLLKVQGCDDDVDDAKKNRATSKEHSIHCKQPPHIQVQACTEEVQLAGDERVRKANDLCHNNRIIVAHTFCALSSYTLRPTYVATCADDAMRWCSSNALLLPGR